MRIGSSLMLLGFARQASAYVSINARMDSAAASRMLASKAPRPGMRRPTKLKSGADVGNDFSEHPLFVEVTALGDEIRKLKTEDPSFKGSPGFVQKIKELNKVKAALKRATGVNLMHHKPAATTGGIGSSGDGASSQHSAPIDLTSVNWHDRASVDFAPNGVLAVYKPQGWTSSDVVAKVKGALKIELGARQGCKPNQVKLKVGHGGTLDPLATGVLVIGVGAGCRDLESYLKGKKRYRGVGLLGTATTTLDAEGEATRTAPWRHVTCEALEEVLPTFTGAITQVPPMYSALQQNGKRLYDLAREGVVVDRPSRDVHVHHLSLLTSNSAWEAAAGWVNTNSHGGKVVSAGDGINSTSSRSLGSSASGTSSREDNQSAIISRQVGLAPTDAKGGVLAETPPFLLARTNEHGDVEHVPRPVHHARPSRDNDDKRGRGSRKKKKKGPEATSEDERGDEVEDGKKISENNSSAAAALESPTARVGPGEVEDVQDSLTENQTAPPIPEISRALPPLPYFALDISCGGGTYVRSLIDDIATHPKVNSVAHMVWLERTSNGPFGLSDCLPPSLWTFENICAHVVKCTSVAHAALTAGKEGGESLASGGDGGATPEK